MTWLLGGYMWLFIHRPFEAWPALGSLGIERVYMMVTLLYWLIVGCNGWIRNPLNAAFGLFGLVLTSAWLYSPYFEMGSETVSGWFKIAVFYVLVMSTARTERDLKQLVAMYLVAVGLYMAHSLWEYRNGRFQWTMGTARMLGVDLTNGDPNTFAATILYSVPIALVVWPICCRLWQRALLAMFFAMATVCVLLTSSRSAFVGICFMAVLVAMISKRRLTWLLILAMAAPVVWHNLPADRQNRFLTLIDSSYGPPNAQESAAGRTKGWRDGVQMWKDRPVLGVGPGAFGRATGTGFESHHLYGQILGELGTLGVVAFAGILFAFLWNTLNVHRLCRDLPELLSSFPVRVVWGTNLTVILLLLMGFGGHNLYRYTWLWFAAFQGLAVHCLAEQNRKTEAAERSPADDRTPAELALL